MNRVLKSADATPYFGGPSPRFLDPGDAAMLEAAVAAARAEGYAEGRRVGHAEAQQAAQTLQRALADAVHGVRLLRDDAVEEAVELGCAIADSILGEDRFLSTERLAEQVRDAIAGLDDPNLTIDVAPVDLDPLEQLLAGSMGAELRADRTIRPGEARIGGSWASAEITKRAALEVAREALT